MRFSEKITTWCIPASMDAEVAVALLFLLLEPSSNRNGVSIRMTPSRRNLPLTMYRQIEKMSIYSLGKWQAVHKYNVDLVDTTYRRAYSKAAQTARPSRIICASVRPGAKGENRQYVDTCVHRFRRDAVGGARVGAT
jgi:hypothetical protein